MKRPVALTRISLFVAALMTLAAAVEASSVVRQDIGMMPSAQAPVLVLQAGEAGETVLGASRTSAAMSEVLLGPEDAAVLRLDAGSASWDVQVRILSATGFTGAESMSLALVGGTISRMSVDVGSTVPLTGAAVALPAGGTLEVTASSTTSCGGCSVALEFRSSSSLGQGPLLLYRATLDTT